MVTLSVIIPAYNSGAFVENCLKTVLNQTFKDFELIIVNDGSTDNTLEILEKFAAKDNRITIINQENGGVSAARNAALKIAKGKYITYIDSDDTVPSTSFEDMLSLMADDVDLVVCSYNVKRIFTKPIYEKVTEFSADEINDRFTEFDSVVWMPVCKLFRRDIIIDNNLQYDVSITFGEDHIFNLLYAKYITGRVVVSDKIVYNYHHIRGGLCAKFYPDMHKMQKYVYIKIADYFGGLDSIPDKYHNLYVGAYLKGNIDYYLAWLPFSQGVKYVEEAFEVYDELLNDELLSENFTPTQLDFIKKNDYKAFCRDYIRHNIRKTLWRKVRRTIRRFLEFLQKIFLKRA